MVTTAASVEWTVVNTEVEALQLEYSWIKEFDPRFNVKYRDDKSYPWLAVTVGEEFPRVMVGRGAKKKGTRYFGPYGHAWAIRETVDLLLRVFPMRSCSQRRLQAVRARSAGRACSATSTSARRPASAGSAPRSTARSSTTSATSWPARPRPFIKRHREGDVRRLRGAGLRAGRPAARRPRGAAARRWRSRPSCSATAPTPT